MLIQLLTIIWLSNIVACTACGLYCSLCTNNGCNRCMYPGTYISNGLCNNCSTGCSLCISSSNCNKCNQNYFSSKGFCFYCGDGCKSCTDNIGCTECMDSSLGCFDIQSSQVVVNMNIALIIGPAIGGVALVIIIVVLCRKCRNVPDPGSAISGSPEDSLQRINELRQTKIQWQKLEESTVNLDEDCPICQMPKVNVVTSCKHAYHHLCLKKWLQHKQTCPICRMCVIKEVTVHCVTCKRSSFKKTLKDIVIIFGEENTVCPHCL